MTDDMNHFGFGITKDGDKTTYKYRGAGVSIGFWLSIILLAPIIGVLAAMISDSVQMFFVGVGLVILCGLIFNISRRTTGQFSVSPDAISKNGKHYDMNRVSELLWGTGKGRSFTPQGTVMVGAGVVGSAAVAASAISEGIGAIAGESVSKRSFKVSIRYGRRVIALAENLTEDVAISLFNEWGGISDREHCSLTWLCLNRTLER